MSSKACAPSEVPEPFGDTPIPANYTFAVTKSGASITEPKPRKSRGSIPVIAPLDKRLEFHRLRCGNPKSGVMFPNLNGSPMDLGNLLNRAILPALNRCAVCGRQKEECRRPLAKDKHIAPDHQFERDKIVPE